MRLIVKQKIVSIFRRYEIIDREENIVYKVQGKCSIPKRYHLYDGADEKKELMFIKRRFWAILPKFDFYKDGKILFTCKSEFSIKPRYVIEGADYDISGNFMAFDFVVKNKEGKELAAIMKKRTVYRDAYVLDIDEGVDVPSMIMITIMLDHNHHRSDDGE